MNRLFLAAGVAALAIAAPVSAQKGGNKGGGQAAKVERGGGGQQARAQRGGGERALKAERRGGEARMARAERRAPKAQRADTRGERKALRAQRMDNKVERRALRVERAENKIDRKALRANRAETKIDRKALRADRVENKLERKVLREQRVANRVEWDDDGRWTNGRRVGFGAADCPPGLANKAIPCMPPGQVKNQMVGQLLPAAYSKSMVPLALRDLYQDTDDYYWRYGDNGYLYKVDRDTNLVASLQPLLGGGFGVGQMFPTSYMNSYVPNYYQPFYPDTSDDYYRYANGYVYEVDRDTGLIESMFPLMANGYGVGQMLPASYSVYNVPYQYRDLYYDTDDYYYRYAPGAIYQVDPTTQLITSIVSLLAPNSFAVGQQLPASYGVYNVPMAYRDTYYDTPDAWYRYNNGYIYQVDPTTQLITAIVRAIV